MSRTEIKQLQEVVIKTEIICDFCNQQKKSIKPCHLCKKDICFDCCIDKTVMCWRQKISIGNDPLSGVYHPVFEHVYFCDECFLKYTRKEQNMNRNGFWPNEYINVGD